MNKYGDFTHNKIVIKKKEDFMMAKNVSNAENANNVRNANNATKNSRNSTSNNARNNAKNKAKSTFGQDEAENNND